MRRNRIWMSGYGISPGTADHHRVCDHTRATQGHDHTCATQGSGPNGVLLTRAARCGHRRRFGVRVVVRRRLHRRARTFGNTSGAAQLFDRARSEFHEPITAGCAAVVVGEPYLGVTFRLAVPVRHGLGRHYDQHSTTSVDCLRASASTEVPQSGGPRTAEYCARCWSCSWTMTNIHQI